MDAIKISILVLFIFGAISCSKIEDTSPEDCSTYDYYDCNLSEPLNAEVTVSFTHNSTHKKIPFKIFKGYIDEDIVLIKDTSSSSEITFYLPQNQYYSVEAEYIVNGETIKAVDGFYFEKESTIKCDSICWTTKTKLLRVTIK